MHIHTDIYYLMLISKLLIHVLYTHKTNITIVVFVLWTLKSNITPAVRTLFFITVGVKYAFNVMFCWHEMQVYAHKSYIKKCSKI